MQDITDLTANVNNTNNTTNATQTQNTQPTDINYKDPLASLDYALEVAGVTEEDLSKTEGRSNLLQKGVYTCKISLASDREDPNAGSTEIEYEYKYKQDGEDRVGMATAIVTNINLYATARDGNPFENPLRVRMNVFNNIKFDGENLIESNSIHKGLIESSKNASATFFDNLCSFLGMKRKDYEKGFEEKHGRMPRVSDILREVDERTFKVGINQTEGKNGRTYTNFHMTGTQYPGTETILQAEGTL